MELTEKQIRNFYKKVKVSQTKFYNDFPCWEWIGSLTTRNYGQFRINNEILYSHRISYILEYGDILNNLYVLHHCDNPSCLNPKHLFLGTQQENIDDMFKKNRTNYSHKSKNKGESHGRSFLKKNEIMEIHHLYNDEKITIKELARTFKTSQTNIKHIVRGERWKDCYIEFFKVESS